MLTRKTTIALIFLLLLLFLFLYFSTIVVTSGILRFTSGIFQIHTQQSYKCIFERKCDLHKKKRIIKENERARYDICRQNILKKYCLSSKSK